MRFLNNSIEHRVSIGGLGGRGKNKTRRTVTGSRFVVLSREREKGGGAI